MTENNEKIDVTYKQIKRNKICGYIVYIKIDNCNKLFDMKGDFNNFAEANQYAKDLLLKYENTPRAKCYLCKQSSTDDIYLIRKTK